jgi:hypothetical protein
MPPTTIQINFDGATSIRLRLITVRMLVVQVSRLAMISVRTRGGLRYDMIDEPDFISGVGDVVAGWMRQPGAPR